MRYKKKSKKKHPIRPSPLTPEEQARVLSLLQDLKHTGTDQILAALPDSNHARLFIDHLPLDSEASVPILLALKGAFTDKAVQKEIKRAVYKLKKKGVSIEAFEAETGPSPSIVKPVQKEKPSAYIGPVGMGGFRAILVSMQRASKGVELGVGLVSDEHGIEQFMFSPLSRKRAKELTDSFRQEVGLLVETSLSHAATILERAYQGQQERGTEVPPDYLELRPWLLENAVLLEQPMIYAVIPETLAGEEILTHSQLEKLFEHELAKSWLIAFEHLEPFMEDMANADASPLVLTEPQKLERVEHIKEYALTELFNDKRRELWKHRFEELAYLFFKLDQEAFVRLSLSAAGMMEARSVVLGANPVAEFLLERSIYAYMDIAGDAGSPEQAEDTGDSSGIILP